MSKFTDKNSYTVLFAVIMVVVVGTLLAGVAEGLSDRIAENERFEKMQNILYAMGINENKDPNSVTFISTDRVEEVFHDNIKEQLVFQGDSVYEDPEAYLIDIKKEADHAKKDADYQRRYPLFVGEKDGETIYVVPMRGNGLWDAIWGYMGIDKDFIVKGVFFDHAGETPGLGSGIKDRYFMDPIEGEHLMSNGSFRGIDVAKGNNDPANRRKEDNKIDALAGATITGDGISNMIKKDVSTYVPFIQKISKEQ